MAGGLFNFAITTTFQQTGNTAVSGSVEFSDNTVNYFGQLVPANSTAEVFAWEFFHTNIQAFFISAGNSATGNTTVAFYNSTTLEATYILAPGQYCGWDADGFAANATQFPVPFAADITSIKVTTGATAVNVIGAVVNAN